MPLYSGLDEYNGHQPTREEYAMREAQDAEWAAHGEMIVAPVEKPATMVRAAIGDVTEAIIEYTKIKDALDRALPDCIQTIQGKQFRKKNYWRAIATAFNLSLELREEKLDEPESGWGYLITYRATAPNGRFADGDGSCYASEKPEKQATVHNVRAHAHTRAMNRAISNLVGFGEVSAEEMPHDDSGRGAVRREQVAPVPRVSQGAEGPAPRPVTTQNATEEGIPLTPDMLALPFLDEKLNFGKHKDKTWRDFCGGGGGSGRIQYLGWLMNQEAKSATQIMNQKRAETVWALVGLRDAEQSEAAGSQVPDPAWED